MTNAMGLLIARLKETLARVTNRMGHSLETDRVLDAIEQLEEKLEKEGTEAK